ncbi:MAG: DHH family phosphoesterase [Candidatus Heimdallarchaeaceae archaeon]
MHEKFTKIIEILKEEEISSVGVFTHQNADPDSIACAIGLKELLLHFIPALTVNLFASTISNLSKKMLTIQNELFHARLLSKPLEAIFLCDTNNLLQVGNFDFEENMVEKIPIFIIDHHSYHKFSEQARISIIQQISSSSEILAQLFLELDVPISQELATVLLVGMLFDSRRFRHTSEFTFKIVQYLLDNEGDYEEALELLHQPMQVSEKMARIKGATRIKFYKVNNHIFTLSYISSFESSLARALINLGADFALTVAVQPDTETRISMRCTKVFAEQNNINLGDIANKFTNVFPGSGGGHSTAAGINLLPTRKLPKDKEELLDLFLKIIMEEIKQS